jgi:hypothetical protein
MRIDDMEWMATEMNKCGFFAAWNKIRKAYHYPVSAGLLGIKRPAYALMGIVIGYSKNARDFFCGIHRKTLV